MSRRNSFTVRAALRCIAFRVARPELFEVMFHYLFKREFQVSAERGDVPHHIAQFLFNLLDLDSLLVKDRLLD
jgi:hypothetical protein